MKSFGHWVLRVTDSDACWFGLGWLRPAKSDRIGPLRLLISSIILGLPAVLLGVGLIYWFVGRVELEVCLVLFALALCTELLLHAIWAFFWNRRAAALAADDLGG